jgi:hypothetical protein
MIHGRHKGVSLNFQAKIPTAKRPKTMPIIFGIIIYPPASSTPSLAQNRGIFRRYDNRASGYWIMSSIPAISNIKRKPPSNFNPISFFKCVGYLIQKKIHNYRCFGPGKTICSAEGLNEFEFAGVTCDSTGRANHQGL